jgi:hypothetical protein
MYVKVGSIHGVSDPMSLADAARTVGYSRRSGRVVRCKNVLRWFWSSQTLAVRKLWK